MSARAVPPPAPLRGRQLLVARVAWVVVAVAALAIVLFSFPSSLEHFRSVCTVASEVCSERAVGRPTPEGARALQDAGLSLSTYAFLNVAVDKVADFVWIAIGALIFLRRSDDRMALLVSLFLVTFWTTVAVDSTDVEVLLSSQPAWRLPVQGAQIVGSVCTTLFFFLFPGGRFVPRWTLWLAVAFFAQDIPNLLYPDLYSRSPAVERISYMVFLGIVVSITWSLVYRYRRVSSAEQRRQTRWVVFGVALAIAGSFVFQLPVDLQWIGGDTPFVLLLFNIGFTASFLLIPLSVGVAVLRSHLFDIDVLINRTLVYGALTVMLALVYFGGVVGLQRLLSPIVGESNQLATVASTLAIAALFNPLRHRVQTFVDRRFYRKKYDARKTLEGFSAKLREETDLDALNSDLLEVVSETMQPSHVSLWLRPDTTPLKTRRTYN
jgi:hypothetical protein